MDYFIKSIDKNYNEIHQMKEKLWSQHIMIDNLHSMVEDQRSLIGKQQSLIESQRILIDNHERRFSEIKGTNSYQLIVTGMCNTHISYNFFRALFNIFMYFRDQRTKR